MIVGVVTAVLSVAVLVTFIIVRWCQWRSIQPNERVHGYRICYRENSVRPWPGMTEALEVLEDVAREHAPSDYWIEVVPYHELIKTPAAPTGFRDKKRLVPRPAPRTEEEAAQLWIRTAGRRYARFLPFTKKHTIISLRQLRRGGTRIDKVMRREEGATVFAGDSALFHEVCQHVLAFRRAGSWNELHAVPELKELERACHKAYDARLLE
jgi:hypothetical protein